MEAKRSLSIETCRPWFQVIRRRRLYSGSISFSLILEPFPEVRFDVNYMNYCWNTKAKVFFSKFDITNSSGVNFFSETLFTSLSYYCFPPQKHSESPHSKCLRLHLTLRRERVIYLFISVVSPFNYIYHGCQFCLTY